jgi:WD40 repeat protein
MVAVPDGQHVLLYHQVENKILVFNPFTDHYFTFDTERSINRIEFSPDGSMMAASLNTILGNDTIIIWDIRDGFSSDLQPTLSFTPDLETLDDFVISPDNQYIIGSSHEGDIVVWDIHTGEEVETFEWSRPDWFATIQLAFSPDRNVLAVNAAEIHFFDAATYAETRVIVDREYGTGLDILYGTRNDWFVTHTGYRGTFSFWNIEAEAHTSLPVSASDIEFSPDGRFTVTSGLDGTIRLWGVRLPE